ncbi:hypothetical protein DBR46_27025 [Pseudomonas sp. KBW05]|nr:hypothetical protein DBR46_27025 [Pseudomonas sp. KBW05]
MGRFSSRSAGHSTASGRFSSCTLIGITPIGSQACGGPLAGFSGSTPINCGSGGATIRLARECGGSVDTKGECQSAFASKPAPTLDLCRFDRLR